MVLGAMTAAAVLAGCGDGGTDAEPLRLEGRWSASTANGMTLPADVFQFPTVVGHEHVSAAWVEVEPAALTLHVTGWSDVEGWTVREYTRHLAASYRVRGRDVEVTASTWVDSVRVEGAGTMTLYARVPVSPTSGYTHLPMTFLLTRDE